MHIPDGFLDTKTIITTSVISLAGVARALREIRTQMAPRQVPLMGLAAAFIFVAQMINFPVVGGTSGHLLGAVLVSALLGPSAGILVMFVVLVVQCLLFADGGVLALGANIFNMGIIATIGGYAMYRAALAVMPAAYGRFAAVAFAAWFSTVLASACCAGELAWSGVVPWSLGFPAMTGIHILIGIGEGLITMMVLAAIYSMRPDLVTGRNAPEASAGKRSPMGTIIYAAIAIAGLILFVLPFASPWPDGLERVARTLGFESKALGKPLFQSPIAEYRVPGIGSLAAATALAGVAGAIVVFGLSIVLAKVIGSKKNL